MDKRRGKKEDCTNGKRCRDDSTESLRKTKKMLVGREDSGSCSIKEPKKKSKEKHSEILAIENDVVLLDNLLGDSGPCKRPTRTRDSGCVSPGNFASQNSKMSQFTGYETAESPGGSKNGKTSDENGETLFDDLEDFFDEPFDDRKPTELAEFTKCKIASVERFTRYTKLTVQDLKEHAPATVHCDGFWKDAKVEVDDTVSIKAKRDGSKWIIDNNDGFLITQPHTLISGTTVCNAVFCLRRSVLSERFRGCDALPNMEIDDCGATVGQLVHEVLQTILRKRLSSIADIRKVTNDVMNSQRGISMIYESNLNPRTFKEQMESYIPKMAFFMQRYLSDVGNEEDDGNFKGKIETVREIEENIWLPQLGLKGKIDVTVEARVKLHKKIMPLEIKTGRPSFSPEHRGQLLLYNMMMRFLGFDVKAGLLLYIRENLMREVENNRSEEQGLIMLRNSIADYLARMSKDSQEASGETEEPIGKPMELPEPTSFRGACTKCPYNTLCSIYAERDPDLELSEDHILKIIAADISAYLTNEHIEYVLKWIKMILIEDSHDRDVTSLKDIWTKNPRKREKNGFCAAELEICGDVVLEGKKYLHTFVRKSTDPEHAATDFTRVNLSSEDYTIVSTDTRINVSTGYVKLKTKHSIEMLLERDVVRQNPNATFHLDKYPFVHLVGKNLANVACLLNNNEITNKLREIVIDKKGTTFADKLPDSTVKTGEALLFELNKYQRKAVMTVLLSNDYLLVKGMPGTGKTQTLVALIQVLVTLGQSVLITAHTHSAVDNILMKLDKRGIDFLRLGSEGRIKKELWNKTEDALIADCKTPESLRQAYESKNVVAVTCFGSTHQHVARRVFDVCVVDESTQVMQPTVLRPIFSAKKFVLVGDPQQLPPVIRSEDARKMGMTESLFARLDSDNNTLTLKLQYRMNSKIMALANDLTYEGELKAGNSQVANATLQLKDPTVLDSCERWISKALCIDLEDSVVMLNTGQTTGLKYRCDLPPNFEETDMQVCNVYEAAIVLCLVQILIKGGVKADEIGVISPFRAQVEFLQSFNKGIEVNTVDQYQGRDKEVILYSCTRSTIDTKLETREFELLEDARRLTVAVTRAKHKLIIIGDKMSLNRFTPLGKLFNVLKNHIYDLEPERDGFSWKQVVETSMK